MAEVKKIGFMNFNATAPIDILQQVDASCNVLKSIATCTTDSGEKFHKKYILPLLDVASWIQLLPSAKDHHTEPGGGLRFVAQCGFIALRLCEGAIFTPANKSEFRHSLERQYIHAAYLSVVYSAMTYSMWMTKVISDDGEIWNCNERLHEWAAARGGYRVEWAGETAINPKVCSFRASRAVPIDLIAEYPSDVVNELMNSLAPDPHPIGHEAVMQKLVRNAIAKAIDMEMKALAKQYVAPAPGFHADIADGMAQQHASEPISSEVLSSQPVTAPVQPQEIAQDNKNPIELLEIMHLQMFELFRDQIKNGDPLAKRFKFDETGVSFPLRLLSSHGLLATVVEADLRKKGLVIGKDGQNIKLKPIVSKFLTDGVSGVLL